MCQMDHFSKKNGIYLFMPTPYPFALKIKYYILHHNINGPCFISPWQFEWTNTYFISCTGIYHYVTTIFVSNGTLYYLPCFVNFASTYSITTACLCLDITYNIHVGLFVNWIWQCTSLSYISADIKKNPEDIRPNAPMLHFR